VLSLLSILSVAKDMCSFFDKATNLVSQRNSIALTHIR